MGLGGISIWQLLIILAIIVLLFGTKRLRTLGGDLGSAIRGFRKSMQENEDEDKHLQDKTDADGNTIDVEAERKEDKSA